MDNQYAERARISSQYSVVMEHDKWIKEIPPLQLDSSWKVTIIPPFSGAVSRFLVENESGVRVSVYLDCYDSLGCYGQPYWELYPDIDGDTARYTMMDTQGLMDNLRRILNS